MITEREKERVRERERNGFEKIQSATKRQHWPHHLSNLKKGSVKELLLKTSFNWSLVVMVDRQ